MPRLLLPSFVFIAGAWGVYVISGCRAAEHREANVAAAADPAACEETLRALENGVNRELITGKDGGT
jgi:hypothetical protein